MRKNRKKTETYRFNGLWGMKSVDIAELKSLIRKFQGKLADPSDPDEKKWTGRLLQRFQRELEKKEQSLHTKNRDRAKPRRLPSSLPALYGMDSGQA